MTGCSFLVADALPPAEADGGLPNILSPATAEPAKKAGDAAVAPAEAAVREADGPGSDTSAVSEAEGGSARSPLVQLCAGVGYACGLTRDGRAQCWGDETDGQTALPDDRVFKQLSCGDYHSCGVDAQGFVVCAGRNASGQRVRTDGPYVQVAAGGGHTCLLTATGKVDCHGDNGAGQIIPKALPRGYSALSAGPNYTCGIAADTGYVHCWGENDVRDEVVAELPFKAIATGPLFACGITRDGALLCWDREVLAVPAGLSRTKAVSVGGYGACAIDAEGLTHCFALKNSGAQVLPSRLDGLVAVGGEGACGYGETPGLACVPSDSAGKGRVPLAQPPANYF
jgi:hypothetical protein